MTIAIFAIIGALVIGIPLALQANRMIAITMASYDPVKKRMTVIFSDGFAKEYSDGPDDYWHEYPMMKKTNKLMHRRLNKIMRYINIHGGPYPVKHLLMKQKMVPITKVNVKNGNGVISLEFFNGNDFVNAFNTSPANLYGMLRVGNLFSLENPSQKSPSIIRSISHYDNTEKEKTVPRIR